MCCAIWYHLYNLKNVKNTHGGVLLLVVKLQALACNFTTKSNTPPWVFFTCFKLHNGAKSRNASQDMFLVEPIKVLRSSYLKKNIYNVK